MCEGGGLWQKMKKNYIYTVLAALLLAVVAFLFFFPDDMQGNVLQQHDIVQGLANGQEGKAFHEATGETTRWTNSLFSGMPNFQIAPSYAAEGFLGWIAGLYTLWLPSPANLLFAMMLGFFILCLCMKMRWPVALFAAIAWGLSSYFVIIIGAGHIWKFVTLSYIPPTIGGIVLCYRGRYLAGSALAALFGALQLQSNHPQMSYYFLFVILFLAVAWIWPAVKEKQMKRWAIATACCIGAGVIAVGANSASLYNTYEYSKETIRGRATELRPADGEPAPAAGADKAYITAWSYGLDETFSLLIPNVKGGATIKPEAGQNRLLSTADTKKADSMPLSPEERQFMGQFPQYFGDQPMTNGPVYVGAFVLLLAVLAMFVVDGPVATPTKWALFAVSVLAILLSWGHNFMPFTDFFIDYVPGYSKFRTVASILVIVEFTIPLLAAMCVIKMVTTPDFMVRYQWTFISVMGLGAFICLMGWIYPSVFGSPFSAQEVEQLTQAGAFSNPMYAGVMDAVRQSRLSLVSSDSLRSLSFILLGALVCWFFLKGGVKNSTLFACCLSAVVLIDLFSVNKRYVDTDSFTTPSGEIAGIVMTDADRQILKDTSMNYRVLDVAGFGDARSSYFHKTIGGYHAAKLTRYNDLIDRQIMRMNPAVLNMLNARYFLSGDQVEFNPYAMGNAWLVDRVDYVETPDAEMAALDSIEPAVYAVAGRSFEKTLGKSSPKIPGDTIFETTYAPNRLTYHAKSAKGGVAVFSEVYFPWGWKATVDGKPVEIGRVNYVLRALRLPAGSHTVEFTFDPESIRTTNGISIAACILIYILCGAAIAVGVMKMRKSSAGKKEIKES